MNMLLNANAAHSCCTALYHQYTYLYNFKNAYKCECQKPSTIVLKRTACHNSVIVTLQKSFLLISIYVLFSNKTYLKKLTTRWVLRIFQILKYFPLLVLSINLTKFSGVYR